VRRVLGIVSVYCVTLALAAWGGVHAWGDAADKAGEELYPYRTIVRRQLAPRKRDKRPSTRSLVWLGDSTMLGLRGLSYPQLLEPTLSLAGVRSRVVGWLGMDFYDYYFLTPAILRELRPDVLVLVAHLRLFAPLRPAGDPAESRPSMNDLASFLGPDELLPALRLPLAEHELTIPRLVLIQSLRFPFVEQLLRWFEGGRDLAAGASTLEGLGPPQHDRGPLAGFAFMRMILDDTDVEVTPSHPIVRMMQATIRYAVAHGTCVLVVGTPIPYEALVRTRGGYDAARYAGRFTVLRAAVETSGGIFLDAHDALHTNEFVDMGGHFSPDGAAHMTRLVGDVVRPLALHGCPTLPTS
jgi:hypothetical protein